MWSDFAQCHGFQIKYGVALLQCEEYKYTLNLQKNLILEITATLEHDEFYSFVSDYHTWTNDMFNWELRFSYFAH